VGKAPASPAAPNTDQIEKTLRALPPGSVEKFAAVVQPILLNRCGASQCHGQAAKSEFRLLRPPEGQIASRRFTQRNLYAALGQVNRNDPESSPLVTLPQARHGTAQAAIFDKHSQGQLDELIAWARMMAPPAVTAPATIGPAATPLSQPAASGVPTSVMRPQLAGGTADQAAQASQAFTPRDRYDPEIFNRRFHGK
jgi:hypothetical protein